MRRKRKKRTTSRSTSRRAGASSWSGSGSTRSESRRGISTSSKAKKMRKAAKLVDREMVESLKPGSVIVDLAAESGGNCELTEPGETVEHEDVKILGPVNLPSSMPIHASQLLSRNMYNLISHITEDRAENKDEKDPHLDLDFEDEIIDSTCIAHEGEIRDESTREALSEAQEAPEEEAQETSEERR